MKTKKVIFIILIFCYFNGYSQYTTPTTVSTCKNGTVSALIINQSEWSQTDINNYRNLYQDQWGPKGCTVIGDASKMYNCHSYAWHLREGNTNRVWINNATPVVPDIGQCWDQTHNIDKYWTDGCFIKVCSEADADKVHYSCGDHSAVKSTSVAGMWESKWGDKCIMRHPLMQVNYNTSNLNFYASTKITGDVSDLISPRTRTFSVKSISNATYNWTCSNGLSVVGSSNQNAFTVQRSGNLDGDNWVKLQLSTPCSDSTVQQIIHFNVFGVPQIYSVTFANPEGEGYWCSNLYGNTYSVSSSFEYNSATFEARLLSYPSLTVIRTASLMEAYGIVPFGYVTPGFYVFQIRGSDIYGTTEWFETEVENVDCSMYGGSESFALLASPNPTNGDLYVSISKEKPEVKALSKNEKVRYILYDLIRSREIKSWIFDNNQNQQKLNVGGINPGQYVLVVTKGKYRQSTQIIIR